jgi:hypothetical protein
VLNGAFNDVELPAFGNIAFRLEQGPNALELLVDSDTDGDGVGDDMDNCVNVANGPASPDAGGHSQLDANGDGYGNGCDADLNNDGIVNGGDLGAFRLALGGAGGAADFNGDGAVNGGDIAILRRSLGLPPGPSGVAP